MNGLFYFYFREFSLLLTMEDSINSLSRWLCWCFSCGRIGLARCRHGILVCLLYLLVFPTNSPQRIYLSVFTFSLMCIAKFHSSISITTTYTHPIMRNTLRLSTTQRTIYDFPNISGVLIHTCTNEIHSCTTTTTYFVTSRDTSRRTTACVLFLYWTFEHCGSLHSAPKLEYTTICVTTYIITFVPHYTHANHNHPCYATLHIPIRHYVFLYISFRLLRRPIMETTTTFYMPTNCDMHFLYILHPSYTLHSSTRKSCQSLCIHSRCWVW